MTRILISAYSCGPGEGSEPGAGYALVQAASGVGPCWVLTRGNNVEELESALTARPPAHPVTVVGVDGPDWTVALKRRFGAVRLYYALWQRVVAREASRLERVTGGFDIVHHATMSAFWLPIGVSRLGRPLVIGPVSGGTFTPLSLVRYLGWRGFAADAVRYVAARLGAWRTRRSFRRASVVIAQNREMERFARRRLVTDGERLIRHSHASDPEVETPSSVTEGREPTVLFVGRLVTWKGVLLAIDAFAAARLDTARLVVIGRGPALDAMRARAEERGVANRVEFTGLLERTEVLRRMRSASCLLFPSFHDSAGFVVSEALSLGLPVVCLDHGGPGELVRLWETESRAVAPGPAGATVRRLAEAIADFVDSPRPVPDELVRSNSSLADLVRDAYGRALGGTRP
ncbi:MAG TPA: glycosyltransferase family 4 protein [Acidimicrobiia bacterium]|nr:glycosyltransferase family 4 protein [Acidimicrobiia bacterium]